MNPAITYVAPLTLAFLAMTPGSPQEKTPLSSQKLLSEGRYILRGGEAFDRITKLTWQRCTLGRHWEEGRGSVGTALKLNWETAMKQSQKGWRLPTKDELETLVLAGSPRPTLDTQVFPDTGLDGVWWYWTSTPYPKDAAGAWAVHFGDGQSGYAFPHKKGSVRLVRSEP